MRDVAAIPLIGCTSMFASGNFRSGAPSARRRGGSHEHRGQSHERERRRGLRRAARHVEDVDASRSVFLSARRPFSEGGDVMSRWQAFGVPCRTTLRGRRRWTVPEESGIYAVSENTSLVYVGSSVNLRLRIGQHFTRAHWPSSVTVKVSLSETDWRARERRLIERLRPRDNRQWNRSSARYQRGGYW